MSTQDRPVPQVRDNPDQERFEAGEGEHQAYLNYAWMGDRLFLLHTEVPPELGGRGLGGALVRAALERARGDGASVVAFCPFAQTYLRRHPEFQDLVADSGE